MGNFLRMTIEADLTSVLTSMRQTSTRRVVIIIIIITFGHRAFSVAGPMVWNSLPTEFRDLSVGFGDFRRNLKTILFAQH